MVIEHKSQSGLNTFPKRYSVETLARPRAETFDQLRCVPSSPSITTSVCSLTEDPQTGKVPNVNLKRTLTNKNKILANLDVVIFTK